MLKKQVGMVVFLGVFAVVSLTVNTARAWRVRPAVRRPVVVVPQPVFVQQPMVVQRPVYVRSYRRVYRPVWGW